MSDEMTQVPEPEWPTHCEHCGSRLESAQVDVMPGGDEQLDVVVARDVCPNPECPAKVAGGDAEAVGGHGGGATSTAPGSMGGDNGGA
jgi:hypothetical protein